MDCQRSHSFMQKSVAFQTKNADRSILPRNLCLHKLMDRETSFCKNLKDSFTYIMHKEHVLYYAPHPDKS